MIPRPGTWAQVQVGTYLQGDRDETWKVVDEKDGWVMLKNRAGALCPIVRPAPTQLVSILEPTMEEGVAVAAHYLGAVVIPESGVVGGHQAGPFPGGQASQ